jgi:hypothetical protein
VQIQNKVKKFNQKYMFFANTANTFLSLALILFGPDFILVDKIHTANVQKRNSPGIWV